MINIKIIFHVINIIFLTLYLFPGSILGFIFYDDIHKQPQLTRDFFISSNHFYAYFLISFIGLTAYFNTKRKYILLYLIFGSILIEILHYIIPNRSFQISDLFGNIMGVLVSIFIFIFLNKIWKKM